MATDQIRKPTHRCIKCGALWIYHWDVRSWSLFSQHCGSCCDNAEMGQQIEPLPITGSKAMLHPSVVGVIQFFEFAHLPERLAAVSQPFAELAWLVANGPQNAETTVALRKLLEAKDCAVRAVLMKG